MVRTSKPSHTSPLASSPVLWVPSSHRSLSLHWRWPKYEPSYSLRKLGSVLVGVANKSFCSMDISIASSPRNPCFRLPNLSTAMAYFPCCEEYLPKKGFVDSMLVWNRLWSCRYQTQCCTFRPTTKSSGGYANRRRRRRCHGRIPSWLELRRASSLPQ